MFIQSVASETEPWVAPHFKTLLNYKNITEAPFIGAFLVEMKKKTTLKELFSILIPFIMALLSLAVWKQNIGENIQNNIWIINETNAVLLVLLFTTFSFLTPLLIWKRINYFNFLFCFFVVYQNSWFGYYLSKKLFILLYDKAVNDNHVIYVWIMILIVGLISLTFYLTINFFIKKIRPFHIFTFVAVFISVVPASLITVEWFPDHGGLKTFVNSIKLGYPLFWINILLGGTTYALTRKII
jgi:hypothetical protein